MLVQHDDLARLCPRPRGGQAAAIWDGYVDAICDAGILLERFGITTSLRWAHLVATWAHETGGFTILWESGNYTAARVVEIFGPGVHSARVGPSEAARLAHNAYALFERVYGLGNPKMARQLGNTWIGDGYNFRGLGIEQITGREAHERYAGKIGCSLEDLAVPANAIHAALLEWHEKACNEKADRDDVVAVRKAINGGRNGLDDVRRYLALAKRIWPSLAPSASAFVMQAADPSHDDASAAAAAGAVASGAPVILELGAHGDARVLSLQQKLTEAGYPCGAQDGTFGSLTERAVAGFQVAHAMPGTGKVDRETWDAIMAAAPVEAVPGRAHVDGKILAERGDPLFAFLWRKLLAAWATLLTFLGLSVDQAADLGGLDASIDKLQQAHDVAGKAWGLVGSLFSLRTIVTMVVISLAVWGIISAGRALAAHLQAVRRGAILGGSKS